MRRGRLRLRTPAHRRRDPAAYYITLPIAVGSDTVTSCFCVGRPAPNGRLRQTAYISYCDLLPKDYTHYRYSTPKPLFMLFMQ